MSGKIDPIKIHQTLEKNVQHVGRQAEVISKKDLDKLASAKDTLLVHSKIRDQVSISQKAHKSAEHTGALGAEGLKTTKKDKPAEARDREIEKARKEGVSARKAPEEATLKEKIAQAQNIKSQAKDLKARATPPTTLAGNIPPGGKLPPGAGVSQPGALPPPGSSATDAANHFKAVNDDLQNAYTIYAQMAANRQKWMMKLWEILQDLQTSIFEIIQSVILRREQAMDSVHKAWVRAIRGDY